MQHLTTRWIAALAFAAAGLAVASAASVSGGQPGQPKQAGQTGQTGRTSSCTSEVHTTSSGSGGTQSNSSSVSQSATGGAGGAGGQGAAGGAGGDASCASTIVQSNQSPGGSVNVTRIRGSGSAPLQGALTTGRARQQAVRIAIGLDRAARSAAPSCRRSTSGMRCTLRWTPKAGGRATLRVDFRHTGSRLMWHYTGTRRS